MVIMCMICMHCFHQTALPMLLGVLVRSHLPKCLPSYVPLHLTQIFLHLIQLCLVLCNHTQKYLFVLVWFVFSSSVCQCLPCPVATFILHPSEPGLLAWAARTAGESMKCWEAPANPGVVAMREKGEEDSLCPLGRLGSCCIFLLLRADRLFLWDGNC